MSVEFQNFVFWLNKKYDKLNNRQIIDIINDKIFSDLNNLNIKIKNENFKNSLTAFIYENSLDSRIKYPQVFMSEYNEEKEYYDLHYQNDVLKIFQEIKEYINFYRFNILDSKNNSLDLNFTDFIFQNVNILLPDKNDEEENEEEFDYDYY